jgi:oligoendopeptidase F
MALEYGYKNFYEYSLDSELLSKTTLSQVQEIHKSIGKVILPMVRLFVKQRQNRLGIQSIRPWDLEADPEVAALKPFETTNELVEKAITILYDIRFEYGILLNKMYNSGLLDLDYRPEKAKGEFYAVLPSLEAGRILMNCTGDPKDVAMLFHEMGHIIQTAILLKSPLAQFNILPVQARELASQALVYFSVNGWDAFYPDKKDFKTAFRSLFEQDIMQLFFWSVMNQFELVLYANPEWNAEQREKALLALLKQHDRGVDWTGLEDWQSIMWMQELTLFELPQYSFFSSLSIINVLQIFKNYRHDPMDTISKFQRFLEKVTDLTVDEMFVELNIKQDYSERHMQKMMDFVLGEYKRIGS